MHYKTNGEFVQMVYSNNNIPEMTVQIDMLDIEPYRWETLNFSASGPRLCRAALSTPENSSGLSTFSDTSSINEPGDPMCTFSELFPDAASKSFTYDYNKNKKGI